MKYIEASLLARMYPGSVIRPSGDDDFIVVNSRGELINEKISSETKKIVMETSSFLNEKEQKIFDLNQTVVKLNKTIEEFIFKNANLEKDVAHLKNEMVNKDRTIELLRSELTSENEKILDIESKLSQINDDEWTIIRQRQEADNKELYNQKKVYRATIICTCQGLRENCHFCDGRGSYVVDGFGNRI